MKRAFHSPAIMIVAAFSLRFGLACYWNSQLKLTLSGLFPVVGYETGRIAASIAAGHGFSSPLSIPTGPTAWLPPIYPYLLALVFKLCGTNTFLSVVVGQAVNITFSAFTCLPIYALGRRLLGQTTGAVAGWVWVILPSAVMMPIEWIWDTSLSTLLAALVVWASYEVRDSKHGWEWTGYGALWAIAALTNAALLSLLPFLLGWMAWRAYQLRHAWFRHCATVAIVIVLGVTPWLVRNYLVFGQFVFLRSNFGLELWLGNNAQVPDTWAGWLHPNDNEVERERFTRMGEIRYMAEKQREAVNFMIHHPAAEMRFFYRRFAYNWLGAWDPIVDIWPNAPWNFRALLVSNSFFSVLSFVGLFLAWRLKRWETLPFAAGLLIYPCVYYITHSSLRYRHPIDPLMTILFAFALVCAASAVSERMSLRRTEAVSPPAPE